MLALLGRNSATRASQLWQISDELLAYDLDNTCTARLMLYDAEKEMREAKRLAAMFGAETEDETRELKVGDTITIPGEM